jgi:hypothetical protein
MSSLDTLQPADNTETNMYKPYYKNKDEIELLPLALSLYKQGFLEGERKIEGKPSISFVGTWSVSKLPADLTRCRIQFEGNAELNYEISLSNSEFINFLIQLINNFRKNNKTDFSQGFYRKLLGLDED